MDRFEITIQRSLAGTVPIAAEWTRADGSPPVHSAGELKLDRAALEAENDVRAYGEMLGRAVFDEEIGIAFAQAEAAAVDRLHVLLEVEDPDLKGLRWQRLCALRDGAWRHLMLGRRTPFSLYVPSPIDRRFVPFGRPELRTLIVAASPAGIKEAHGLDPFDPKEAIAAVKSSLGDDIPCYVLADVPDADGPPTLEALTKAISGERFPLVHFVCHGAVREDRQKQRYTFLYLNDVNGRTDPVDAGRLVDNLANLNGPYGLPHFVFLAACEGAGPTATGAYGGLAEQLVRDLGMPAVLAMTEPVSIETANDLAKAFYKSVREHGEIDRALGEACAGLAEAGDVTVPAIFSRLGTRSLFAGADRAPSDEETEEGLTLLDDLFRGRAPVLRERLAAAASKLRRTLGMAPGSLNDAARAEQDAARREIDALCSEVLECSFASLAIEKKVPDYDARCPFRGLEAFRTDDKDFFFGRALEIERLKQRLCWHPFLAVVGRSGSGKSSLVLAGLLPALSAENPPSESDNCALPRESVVCEPDSQPLANLERTVAGAAESALIVVDQFEEVFTHGVSEADQEAFFTRLLDLGATHPIVITLRDDFVADCARHDRLREAVQDHQELIAPMSSEALRDAIGRQASVVGLDFEAGLADTILTELGDEPGAMSLLQYTLLRLWDRRHGRWLRASEYTAIGRVQGALAQRAEEVFCALDPGSNCERLTERRGRARQVFVRLTRLDDDREDDAPPRDARQRVALSELIPAGEAPAATEAIVEELIESRLLVKSMRPRRGSSGPQVTTGAGTTGDPVLASEETVELSHEALIRHWPRLQRWIEEDRKTWRLQQEIGEVARNWRQAPDDKSRTGYLYRDPPLLAAEALQRQPLVQLNTDEHEFITASVALRDREAARATMIARVAKVSAIVFLVLLILSCVLWVRAETQRSVSLARALAAQAIGEHDRGEDQRAALLARQAWLFDADKAAQEQIGTALQATIGAPFFSTLWRDPGAPAQPLTALALDSRGRYLAAAGQNQSTIRIWDLRHPGGEPLRLTCHGNPVTSVAFAPGTDAAPSAYLASGSGAGGIILWRLDAIESLFAGQGDASDDPCAQGLERTTLDFTSALRAVTFGRNGDNLWLIAGGCRDTGAACPTGEGVLRIWKTAAPGEPTEMAVTGQGAVWSVAVSKDGTLAAGMCQVVRPPSNSCDKNASSTISIWNSSAWAPASSAAPPNVLGVDGLGHRGGVAALAFSPDGERLASGGDDRVIRLWNLDDSTAEELTGHDAEIGSLSFSPDGTLLASGSQDETVRIWDMSRGTRERAIAVLGGSEEWVRSLAFAQSGANELTLAATSAGGTARIWRIRQSADALEPPGMLRGHDHYVRALAFAPDGSALASSGEDGTVRLWGIPTASPDEVLSQLGDEGDADTLDDDEVKITSVAYSHPNGVASRYLAAGDARGKIWVRDLADPEAGFVEIGEHDLDKKDNGVTAVAFSPGADLLASGGMDGTVRFWDPAGGALGEPLLLGDVDVRAVAFNQSGTMLAAAGCRLGRSGSCEFDTGFVVFWEVVPNGGSLATGATLYRCEVGARASLQIGNIRDMPFLCDGQERENAFGGVASIAFGTPGSRLFATGHANGAVVVWDVDRLLRPDEDLVPRLLGEHDGEVRVVAFSPATDDGSDVILASGSVDQTMRLWDPSNAGPVDESRNLGERLWRVMRGIAPAGNALATIGGRDEFVRALAFSPRIFSLDHNPSPESPPDTSPILASAAPDGAIRLSIASSEALAEMVCQQAWRNLSQAEWDRFVGPDMPYQLTCPDLPTGEGT